MEHLNVELDTNKDTYKLQSQNIRLLVSRIFDWHVSFFCNSANLAWKRERLSFRQIPWASPLLCYSYISVILSSWDLLLGAKAEASVYAYNLGKHEEKKVLSIIINLHDNGLMIYPHIAGVSGLLL